MPAPLTIVIPTLNAAQALPATFAHLVEGLQAGVIAQVVVVDGGSQDATCAIARDWGATVLTHPASRGGQLRAGADAATSPVLLFLHADTHLAVGWTQCLGLIDDDTAGYFKLQFRASGLAPWCVAGWANLRSRIFGLPYGDQALLIRRSLYDAIGGYPDIPLMEDVAIIRNLPNRPVMLPSVARTDAVKYQSQGWLTRGARNLITLIRYLLGTPPSDLAKKY